ARVVSGERFDAEMLNRDLDKDRPGSKPCVLILANVPKLTPAQQTGVVRFLKAGGGVLVTLGDRLEPNIGHYNGELYRKGEGWLPARLDKVIHGGVRKAASPLPSSFSHSAVEFVRENFGDQLNATLFPRWWGVTPAEKGKGVVVGRL